MTAENIWIGDESILPNATVGGPEVQLQTAYPYIGFPNSTWYQYRDLVNTTLNYDLNNKFRCEVWGQNEFCYWYNTDCSQVNLPDNFSIQFGTEVYSIPMNQLIAQTQRTSSVADCDLYFAPLNDLYGNNIRLGDPFFASFLPIFNVETEELGLAMNARAYEGSSITEYEEPEPEPTPTDFIQ